MTGPYGRGDDLDHPFVGRGYIPADPVGLPPRFVRPYRGG